MTEKKPGVTDGALNMLKLIKIPGYSYPTVDDPESPVQKVVVQEKLEDD